MIQRKILWGICCVVMWISGNSLVHALSINVYTDRANWENAAPGAVWEESFGDAILNAEISSVDSDLGFVDTGNGRWWDRVGSSNNWTTTFNFSTEIFAFGGEWDLAGPGGPGQGILITLPFSTDPTVLSIDRSNAGEFWGFVSDVGFNSVTIQGWTQSGKYETFEMDNLVYSAPTGSGNPVPEPQTILLLGSGFGGLLGWRVWKKRS